MCWKRGDDSGVQASKASSRRLPLSMVNIPLSRLFAAIDEHSVRQASKASKGNALLTIVS